MTNTQRRQSGSTLIEAMLALLIMGVGMLSLSGMQMDLTRSADSTQQRTQALRLAQEKMEEFRSYTGIASTVTGTGAVKANTLNWNALVDGQDSFSGNAVYTRTWSFGGGSGSPSRRATVRVAWTDRNNAAQWLSLSSALSQTDPFDAGLLGFPLSPSSQIKGMNNRSLAIPAAAISLGNQRSALAFGAAGQYLLLNDISGDVVRICTAPGLTNASSVADFIAAFQNPDSSQCKNLSAYLVSGYVGRDSSVSTSDWNAIEAGLGIDYAGIVRNAAGALGIQCQFGNAINPNTGAIIPDYKYYLCVIPLADPAAHVTPDWSGKIRLAGPAAWQGSDSPYYVCRYEYAATQVLSDGNQRNLQPYSHVNTSISQQNYLIARTSNASNPTPPVCPSAMNVAKVSSGVLHQDCRAASNPAGHSADCPRLAITP